MGKILSPLGITGAGIVTDQRNYTKLSKKIFHRGG
jgi:hypothetical protein